jgi:hypothetical protein
MRFQVSRSEYDGALDVSEALLIELAETLDRSVRDEIFERSLLALGKRARSIFRGFTELVPSNPTAAFVLLRPATEINLVVRFLVAKPDVHVELWDNEGEREHLRWIDAIERDQELAHKMNWPGVDQRWKQDRRDEIEEARKLGRAAGVKCVSKVEGERVMPNMREIADIHGDLTTRQAYAAAYQPLSNLVHASSRSFVQGAFYDEGDGSVTFEELIDVEGQVRSHRALNASIFASTLTVLSAPLALDILDTTARVRDSLVALTITE